jgi:hypothetical protein
MTIFIIGIAVVSIALGAAGAVWAQDYWRERKAPRELRPILDWRPTLRMDARATAQAELSEDDNVPANWTLQTEEIRLVESVGGYPHVEIRWRPATRTPSASRLRRSGRCHLPVASTSTSAGSKRVSERLRWRMPCAVLATRSALPAGSTWTSSQSFADADSHSRVRLGLLFGRFLALHAGRAPYHLLRTRAEGRTDHAHPRCQTPGGRTVSAIRVGAGGHRLRRTSQSALIRSSQHARGRGSAAAGPGRRPAACVISGGLTSVRSAIMTSRAEGAGTS